MALASESVNPADLDIAKCAEPFNETDSLKAIRLAEKAQSPQPHVRQKTPGIEDLRQAQKAIPGGASNLPDAASRNLHADRNRNSSHPRPGNLVLGRGVLEIKLQPLSQMGERAPKRSG